MDDFINALLERLLATSLQTSILTTVVWILCRYVPRLSPASQCWLWWLVALQALLGLFVSPIALPWLPHAAVAVGAVTPEITWTPIPDIAAAPSAAPQIWISWQVTAFLLWATGLMIMASITLRDWRRSNALLTDSVPCDDEGVLQLLARDSATCGLRSAPGLRVSNRVDSPVLIGHFRPVLLLPAGASLSAEDLDMALVHELTHLRRGDLWWGFIPSLARHLFFFNPFAHVAVREYDIAREAACDGVVVQTDHCRQDYGRLLVRLGTTRTLRAGLAVASPTFFALSRRLIMLQNTSFLPRTASVAVLIFVAAAGVMPLRLVEAATAKATAEILTPVSQATRPANGEPARRQADPDTLTKVQPVLAQRAAANVDTTGRAATRDQLAFARERLGELRLVYLDAHPEVQFQLERIRALSNAPGTGADPAAPTPQGALEDFKIGLEDVLYISVFQNPELSGAMPVRPDGRISTPLVENMVAAGKTPSQLARDIETSLARYVRAPKVTVIVREIAFRR